MAKYFTYEELIKSATAEQLNIDNTPPTRVKNNILELIEVLDMIREAWTVECKNKDYGIAAIIVNSGYRCEALNEAVCGSKTSSHMIGTAADLEAKNGHNKELLEFLELWLIVNEIDFDELINEKPIKGVPSWVHFSIRSSKGEQRKKVITLL